MMQMPLLVAAAGVDDTRGFPSYTKKPTTLSSDSRYVLHVDSAPSGIAVQSSKWSISGRT